MKQFTAWPGLMLLASMASTLIPPGHAQNPPPDAVLIGDVTGAQNKTYFEVPFAVPTGIHRISVDFQYTGKEERATLDLGVADPERFRGESGGNKSHFTISETDATPSYLPGAIPAGQWRLFIAVPNMRPQTVAHYRAEIRFNAKDEDASFAAHPLATGTRWYRGDLHMHTAHSDGSCASQSGKMVPCPVFVSVQTAAARGLDFIAITDHNADSQNNALRELQPYFDRVLLIPGREMTTFHGHFNMFGITQFVDYRVTANGLDLNTVLRDIEAKGGIASVSHAEAPEGESCMGCQWMPTAGADMNLFSAVEVINGGQIMFSSAKYWDAQLRDGHRLAAIGGSDSHNATHPPGPPGSIGWPTTAVEADELSVPAILKGIRAGRTFVDLTASHDKELDIEADSGGAHARMGETLSVSGASTVHITVRTAGCTGSVVHLLLDGEEASAAAPVSASSANGSPEFTISAGAGRHWLRAEVRDRSGGLQLVSSPLYIDFP
ncbi:MAG: CehA/McbA family metallohydrolase [Terracidiphilus sp.]